MNTIGTSHKVCTGTENLETVPFCMFFSETCFYTSIPLILFICSLQCPLREEDITYVKYQRKNLKEFPQ